MSKTDLICVVSGDIPTTELRIERALQRFYDSKAGLFLLNGFNTSTEHDGNFEGESWRDDVRVKSFYHELEKINPMAVHAKNTVVNGVKLREVLFNLGLKNAETVTSKTHMKRLQRIFYSIFPEGEFEHLSFSVCGEVNERVYKISATKELLEYPFTETMLAGIKRGDPNIAEIYDQRRYNGIVGKTLSLLKPVIERN